MIDLKQQLRQRTIRVPLWNEATPAIAQGLRTQPSEYVDIDFWIKNTPEAIGIINAIKTDMTSDGVKFFGTPNKVKRAKEFYRKTFMKAELDNAIRDWLIYGDSALWISALTEEEIQAAVSAATDTLQLKKIKVQQEDGSFKTMEKIPVDFKKLVQEGVIKDEDRLKAVKHIPWTTMNIIHNRVQITGFRQVVGAVTTEFEPKEIIHARFMTLEGKVYGYSPMRASLPELQNIGYIKDYNKNFYKDGALPGHIFMLKDAMANDPNLDSMRQVLKMFKNPITNRGNLVVGGDWNIQQIESNEGITSEGWSLAIYMTGVLASGYGMPVSRISQIAGAKIKPSTGTVDVANEAYWRNIADSQDYWETLLNNQLWLPFFGVEMKFRKGFKQDEFREAQRDLMITDTINNILHNLKIPVSDDWIMNRLNLTEKDIDEGKRKKLEAPSPLPGMPGQPANRQLQAPTDRVMPGQGAQRQNELRRAEAARNTSRDTKQQ